MHAWLWKPRGAISFDSATRILHAGIAQMCQQPCGMQNVGSIYRLMYQLIHAEISLNKSSPSLSHPLLMLITVEPLYSGHPIAIQGQLKVSRLKEVSSFQGYFVHISIQLGSCMGGVLIKEMSSFKGCHCTVHIIIIHTFSPCGYGFGFTFKKNF